MKARPRLRPSELFRPLDNASLVFFRAAFGLIMFGEALRHLLLGLVRDYYVRPAFLFSYHGFEWLQPWPGCGMYLHFAALALLALGIAAGALYRLSAVLYFLGFTYAFLLDQGRYLNHYYLICLLGFLMIFLPAHRALSVDAWRKPGLRSDTAPAWALWLLRVQIGLVYFFAGVAKLNGDWLRGEPLNLWLRERYGTLLGGLLARDEVALTMSYSSLLLDLLAAPFLLWRRSRAAMFAFLLAFHLLNFLVFNIGVFPWLMIAATLLFLDPGWPRRFARGGAATGVSPQGAGNAPPPARRRAILAALAAYVLVQVVVPLRHWLYPGDVNWTEEGHRFSWRMKLRSKRGWIRFTALDPESGRVWTINPELPRSRWGIPGEPGDGEDVPYLSPRQARKLAAMPDMTLGFAHHLAAAFRNAGYPGIEVRARVLISLNGRPYRLLVDPETDLAAQPRSLRPARWILPLDEPLTARGKSSRVPLHR